MIKLTIGSNVKRETKIVSADMTLRQAFEEAGINYATGVSTLDAARPRRPGQDLCPARHRRPHLPLLYHQGG